MATLRGKITDVTHKPPESLSSITVKAPSVRVGGGTDLIVSSPATVDFDRGTGDVTISGLTGGLSWLYIEGDGWSDSIALAVAEGMVTLVEAIANAIGAPGLVDYMKLLANLDQAALDKVGAAWQSFAAGVSEDIARGNNSAVLSTADVERYQSIKPGFYAAVSAFLQGIGLDGAYGGVFWRTLTNYAQDGATMMDYARWVAGGEVFERYRTYNSAGWSDWITVPDHDTLRTERGREIPDAADWDTLVAPGEHRRVSTSHTGTNMPPTTFSGVLVVHDPGHRSGQVTQTFFGAGGGGLYYRMKTSNRWTDWVRLDVPAVEVDVPGRMHTGEARRAALEAVGRRKRGGVIGTGGLPAVALRFDHHLDSFDEKVLPLLKKYNLPWMQAINPGNLGSGGDNWTAAKLATECHRTGGEVWNHGLNHSTFTTEAQADIQITGSMEQLTKAMPSLHIDGWAPYGSFPQMNHQGIRDAADLWSTYPGRLILAQHAFIRTYLPGTHEPLAGTQFIGAGHSTIDKDTTGAARRGLEAAMACGAGISFMLHPVYLDQDGYITTAQLEELLKEIAAQRDAKKLRVLSCTGIMLADKNRPDDFNLLGTLSAPNATGTENVNTRSFLVTTGVPHEAVAWVQGTGTATLTVEITSATFPVTVTQTLNLTSTPQRLACLVTPPTDTTAIAVTLTADGAQHNGVKYRPI